MSRSDLSAFGSFSHFDKVHDTICSVFAYGTLKTGCLRASLWPRKPKHIWQAVVNARLFDLGPYPAALVSQDLGSDEAVQGEIWGFEVSDMPETLRVLDEVEGFDSRRADNAYVRELIHTYPLEENLHKREVLAWIYLAPDQNRLAGARRIAPFKRLKDLVQGEPAPWHDQIVAAWPDPFSRVPRSFSEE